METTSELRWYTAYAQNTAEVGKVVDQIKTLVADEPEAVVEQHHARTFVKTKLTWDFLREALPTCLVAVAEYRNRGEHV